MKIHLEKTIIDHRKQNFYFIFNDKNFATNISRLCYHEKSEKDYKTMIIVL